MADTIRLQSEVVVHGATPEQLEMYHQMAKLFEDRFALFVEKNMDYGSSFLTAGNIDMELSDGSGPFNDATEANLYKLFTRLQDKNQRFYQQVFCGGDNNVGESASETAGDAAVYWFMVNWLINTQ